MFKTYSNSSSLVITSCWFATSRLRVPASVRRQVIMEYFNFSTIRVSQPVYHHSLYSPYFVKILQWKPLLHFYYMSLSLIISMFLISKCRHAPSIHTMDLLWEKFQWILPLYMKPISFQSKALVDCSVTEAIFIDFCLKKLNVFSQHIGQKTNEYLNSAEQVTRN